MLREISSHSDKYIFILFYIIKYIHCFSCFIISCNIFWSHSCHLPQLCPGPSFPTYSTYFCYLDILLNINLRRKKFTILYVIFSCSMKRLVVLCVECICQYGYRHACAHVWKTKVSSKIQESLFIPQHQGSDLKSSCLCGRYLTN